TVPRIRHPFPTRRSSDLSARQILEGQLEEQVFARLAFLDLAPNGRVVARAVLDGVVEDRGVGCEARHGELVDIACEGPGLEQVAGDVVEPEALAAVVQRYWC